MIEIHWIWLVVSAAVGAIGGIIVMACCVAGGNADRAADKYAIEQLQEIIDQVERCRGVVAQMQDSAEAHNNNVRRILDGVP